MEIRAQGQMNLKKYFLIISICPLLALFLLIAWPFPAPAADPKIIWGGPPEVKQVALTFDDGPSPRYTLKILSLLREHQAHATFFVLGAHVELYPRVVQATLREGHEVGNHSFDHPRLSKSDEPSRERELERTTVNLDLLGCKARLFRPPFSDYDGRLVAYLNHTNRRLVLWGIDSGDWRGLPAETIAHNVLSRVRPGAIIIFHDSNENERADRNPTVEALKEILPGLKAMGYRMVTVSELVAEDKGPKSSPRLLKPPIKPPPKPAGPVVDSGSL